MKEKKSTGTWAEHTKRGRAKILSLWVEVEVLFPICFELLWFPFLWKGTQYFFIPNTKSHHVYFIINGHVHFGLHPKQVICWECTYRPVNAELDTRTHQVGMHHKEAEQNIKCSQFCMFVVVDLQSITYLLGLHYVNIWDATYFSFFQWAKI